MGEEQLMILKMIQEGKITPEQGESLLRALPGDLNHARPSSMPPPPVPPTPSVPPPVPASYGDLQERLADVQVKLGELQSKLGAATNGSPLAPSQQNPRSTTLPFGLGELNLGQMIDEAVRGVNSLKAESVRSFKLATRAAQKEGRKIRKEAKKTGKNLGFDLNLSFLESGRPRNAALEKEQSVTGELALDIAEGRELRVINRLGNVKVISSTGSTPHMRYTTKAWSDDPVRLEELIKAVPIVITDDSGKAEHIVAELKDGAGENVTIDLELVIPDTAITHIETTFGSACCEGRSSGAGIVQTETGNVSLVSIRGNESDKTNVRTRSGSISISQFDGPTLTAETISGTIDADALSCFSASLRSRSGDITLFKLQIGSELTMESSSGDISLSASSVRESLAAKTQSGSVIAKDLRVSGTRLESVSGDIIISEVIAVPDGVITLDTVSGDIEIGAVQTVELTAVSISGDVRVEIDDEFDSVLAVRTISGDVDVTIAPESDTRIELTTQTGTIETALDLTDLTNIGSRFLSGILGEGHGTITLQSVSGDVTLK